MTTAHNRKAEEFHRQNPHVLEAMRRLAYIHKNKGAKRWGAKALWEELRWELKIPTNARAGTYNLNNNFHSWYARELAKDPELEGFFELRGRNHPQGDFEL